MKFNIEYIPISKIKPDLSSKMTQRIKKMQNLLWDCVYLLAVRKKKDGNYVVLSGHDRYEYLRKHTTKQSVPCIVDEANLSSETKSFLHWFRHQELPYRIPLSKPKRWVPATFTIVRVFIKEDPRFFDLTPMQQFKVLLIGIHYKKTVVASMKKKVDEFISRE